MRNDSDALPRTTLQDLFRQKGISPPDAENYTSRIRELEEENQRLRKKITDMDENSPLQGEKWENRELSPEILFRKAVSALKEDNIPDAMGYLRSVLILEPENVKAMNNLAVVYSELGYEERAMEILYRVLELEPENRTAEKNLGILNEQR